MPLPLYVSQTDRERFMTDVEAIGVTANTLRQALLDARMPFVAGIVRAAEEVLLVAYTHLKDADVKEL